MMAKYFKQYIKLFESWPIDTTKKGRDFGEYLREYAKINFGTNKKLTADEEIESEKHLDCLRRLSSDIYNKKYPRSFKSSATGLNAKECNILLSQEFLDAIAEDSRGIFSKMLSKNNKDTKDN